MAGKDKRKRRQQKKFEVLLAQFKTAGSPTHAPARSPAVGAGGPLRLNRIQAPFEQVPGALLQRIAAYAATPSAPARDVIKSLASLSRSTFIQVESVRQHHGETPEAIVQGVIAKSLARGQKVPDALQSGAPTLSAVASSGDQEFVARVAFALVRSGRSALHNVRRNEALPVVNEWLEKVVATGALPLSARHQLNGRTLLHYALMYGDRPLAHRLIAAADRSGHAFDWFTADDHRRTALHVAAYEGLADSAMVILQHVNPGSARALSMEKDASKRTIVDAATSARHSKLAGALRQAFEKLAEMPDEDADDEEYEEEEYDEDGDYDDDGKY